MIRLCNVLLLLAMACTPTLVCAHGPAQTASPAVQFKELLNIYDAVPSPRRLLTDEERFKLVGDIYRHRCRMAVRFLELAKKHPKDPIAVDALAMSVWQVNTTPWPFELVGEDPARGPALALLQQNHIADEKLGAVCKRLSVGFCREFEPFLRAVLVKSPHASVRGAACLSLAQFLNGRMERARLVKDDPAQAGEFGELYGKEYLARLMSADTVAVRKEVAALLKLAGDKYHAELDPDGGTVGEKAKSAIYELRQLAVGMQALEIVGRDQDGVDLRLSDYRGKVVLLDFWHQQ